MPPKKRAKAATSVDVAAQAPVAVQLAADVTGPALSPAAAAEVGLDGAASPQQQQLQLTPDGVEGLRALARHRVQRLPLGGIGLYGAAGAAAAAAAGAPPPPPPVTLQIISIHRYFIDHRFWALVGVPVPTLPPAPSTLAYGAAAAATAAAQQQQQQNGMDELMGDGNGAGQGQGQQSAAQSPPPQAAFDEMSDLHVAYDVLLHDGTHQVKALLSPLLSMLVEKGGLLPTGVLRVKEASIRFDETVLQDKGFLVLKNIDIVTPEAGQLILADPSGALSYPSWVDASAQQSKPLIGGPRAYYLSLFNDDTVLFNEEAAAAVGEAERIHLEQKRLLATLEGGAGEQKEPHVAAASSSSSASKRKTAGAGALSNAGGAHTPMLLQDDVLVEPSYLHHGNTVSLRKLLAEGPGYQAGDLSVLARVFAKSRVFNFGRKTVGVRPDLLRAPFSFELLVGDASGEQIKVVVWNTLVCAYWSRVHVGQVVALRGFRLKVARSDGQMELSLNPYNPIGSLRVLTSESGVDPALWARVPPIEMSVQSVAGVRNLEEGSLFDIAGVVTYAGPMRREWNATKKVFFQYRWLLLVDHTTTDALPVKVFTNSQEERVAEIRLSDVLFLSNLMLHSNVSTLDDRTLASASQPTSRSLLATSSPHTQLLDGDAMLRSGHPYLHKLLQWSSSEADHALLRCYPSLYDWSLDFEWHRQRFGEVVTPLRDVSSFVLPALRFQQVKFVLLQAVLADIVVHPAGLREVRQGVMDQESYEVEIRRLIPDSTAVGQQLQIEEEEEEEEETKQMEDVQTSQRRRAASRSSASPSKLRGRGHARFAKSEASPSPSPSPSPAAAASAAESPEPPASQSSTVSSRLRRTTRAATLATEHMLEADAAAGVATATGARRGGRKAAATAAATTKAEKRSRSAASERERRGRSRSRRGEGEEEAVQSQQTTTEGGGRGRRARSAATATRARSTTPVRKGAKLVKVVQRKRKATAQEVEAEAAAAAAAEASPAAAARGSPSAAAGGTAALAASPAASAASFHPSSPSVLATLVLRDLNGEFELRVELDDPVQGHVNNDRAVNSVAATCDTPPEAARIFLGLARVLPASSFTKKSWMAFMQRASNLPEDIMQQAAAAAAQQQQQQQQQAEEEAATAGSARRKRGRGSHARAASSASVAAASAAAAAAEEAVASDPSFLIRAAVAQLHNTLLATLSPFRLLCQAQLTRTSLTRTTADLTGILRAE